AAVAPLGPLLSRAGTYPPHGRLHHECCGPEPAGEMKPCVPANRRRRANNSSTWRISICERGPGMPEPKTLSGKEHRSASDSDLLAWFRAGDEAALETLLERYESALFQFLVGILRNHHQAEDCLQETWCRALERLDGVDGAHLRGWLFTV